jgi:hypothetical protein
MCNPEIKEKYNYACTKKAANRSHRPEEVCTGPENKQAEAEHNKSKKELKDATIKECIRGFVALAVPNISEGHGVHMYIVY